MNFLTVENEVNFMVDIETLDTAKTAAITEIGAIMIPGILDLENLATAPSFHRDCHDSSGTKSVATVEWRLINGLYWQEPPAAIPIVDALNAFYEFIRRHAQLVGAEKINMWCKGTDFDKVILEEATDRWGMMAKIPWKYNNFYDLRTMLKVYPQFKVPKESVAHSGFKDALQQAEQLMKIAKRIEFMNNVQVILTHGKEDGSGHS